MLLVAATTAAMLGFASPPAGAAAPSDVLVRFARTADAGERAAARDGAGTDLEEVLPLRGLQRVDPEPGLSLAAAVKRLERSREVLYAEPNRIRTAATIPNDQLFGALWGMNNTGQSVDGVTGTPDADIDAPEAWDVTTGSQAITVGIADSGMDATQPDLSPNLWTNPAETVNGQDDDGNGLVDDVHGWDWVGGDSSPADANGHGTHVAGTIGARGNDGTGVAGVAWNVGLVPLRVLDASGQGTVADVVKAYTYANQKGLRIVNSSLGSTGSSQAERDAIAAAGNTLFVVAAGNGGSDGVGDDNDVTGEYPCAYNLPNIVCVASSDSNDNLSSFSNYGQLSVDLAAPGERVGSTWPGSLSPCGGSPCWVYLDGTSMATPHVSGAAALILAHDPTASVAAVKSALLGSVDIEPSMAGKSVTGGRLNVYRALTGAAPPEGGGTLPPLSGGTPAPPEPPPPLQPSPSPPSSPEPSPSPTPVPGQSPPPPAPAAPTASPASTSALSVRMAFIRGQTIRSVLRRGLLLRVRCSDACRVRARMSLGRAGRSSAIAQAGLITIRLRPDRRARRTLRRARSLRIRVRIRATDRQGNSRTLSRAAALR